MASTSDPLDVTLYSLAEMKAALAAAQDRGTRVTVQACTSRALRQAVEAGKRCIEHGQLLGESTVKPMAGEGIWWSLQPCLLESDAIPFALGPPAQAKSGQMTGGA